MQVIELQYNNEFITETMRLQSIYFATFGNKGCFVQMSGALYKKFYSHKFASKTCLIYIFRTSLKFSFEYLT